MTSNDYLNDAVELLQRLIATPSVSRNESAAADIMERTIKGYGMECHRLKNNVWVIDPEYDENRQTLLLNAHIDTVKPVATWSRNPYSADIDGDRLYGLGSNDCGGGLVTLLQTYRKKIKEPRGYNLIFLASAEEEVS